MMRRHDCLSRMALTLVAALLCGALLEADGIQTWAERLPVGPLREAALPATSVWHAWTAPLHLNRPRNQLLALKADWAPLMLGQPLAAPASQLVQMAPIAAPVPLADPALTAPDSTVAAQPAVLPSAMPQEGAAPDSAAAPDQAAGPEPVAVASHPASAASTDLPNAETIAQAGFPHGGMAVALAGDSMMAVGLAPTLKRWLAQQKRVQVIPAYRSGTGLSRPEVFDWLNEYPRMLGRTSPGIVICAMGANDAQSVQVGKNVLQFGTPAWDAFFRTRLAAYLAMLTRKQAHVLWVGLPPMRNPAFSKKMTHLNDLLKTTLAAYPNTTWLDARAAMAGPDGQAFQQFRAQHNGKLVKLRADDGIHLTDDGALYLLPPIRNWVAHALDSAPPAKPAALIGVAGAPPLAAQPADSDSQTAELGKTAPPRQ